MIEALLLTAALQGSAIPRVVVTVKVPETVSLSEGEETSARIAATVAEGFKIQANPAANRFLVPLTLEIESRDGVHVGPPEYPEGRPYRLRGATSDLSIYEKTFEIQVPLVATESLLPQGASEVLLEGTLSFQACNAVVCLKPSSVPVRLPVSVRPLEESSPR